MDTEYHDWNKINLEFSDSLHCATRTHLRNTIMREKAKSFYHHYFKYRLGFYFKYQFLCIQSFNFLLPNMHCSKWKLFIHAKKVAFSLELPKLRYYVFLLTNLASIFPCETPSKDELCDQHSKVHQARNLTGVSQTLLDTIKALSQ